MSESPSEPICPHCGKPIQIIYRGEDIVRSVELRDELVASFAEGLADYAASTAEAVLNAQVAPL